MTRSLERVSDQPSFRALLREVCDRRMHLLAARQHAALHVSEAVLAMAGVEKEGEG